MAKEIERKFLVRSDNWRDGAVSASSFRQAYIVAAEDRNLRVRLVNDVQAKLTFKVGDGTLTRDEYEYEIPADDARELLGATVGTIIEKTRHVVPFAGFTWEVDVFEGVYSGLVVAEVELQAESDEPQLPDWIGVEVTGDRRYSNMVLATENLAAELGHGLSHQAL